MIRLCVIKPDKPPEIMVYDKPTDVIVGRSSRCGIVLDFDPLVSRNHAIFLFDPPTVRIKDLHSTNGIRINGEFYGTDTPSNAYSPVMLENGDEVVIGSTAFKIELPGTGAADLRPDGVRNKRPSHHSVAMDADISGRLGAMDTVQSLDVPLPRIPGYRLARCIGSGAVGKVYLGVSNGDERRVAVKVLYPPSGTTAETLKFFFKEFDDARHIAHPHLARLLGAGELPKGGGVFLAAEYADGNDLSGYMRRKMTGRVSPGAAAVIATQIAGAVCRLHMRGMAHLDLKPSSVIVREDAGIVSAKITDAGFTAFLEMAGLWPRVYQGRSLDRLGFLAPEQLTPEMAPGKATDVFSLCALLFYMLTGRPPYVFGTGDNRAVVEKGEMLSPDGLPDVVPGVLADILKKGLCANPEERYPDACRLAEALSEAIRE